MAQSEEFVEPELFVTISFPQALGGSTYQIPFQKFKEMDRSLQQHVILKKMNKEKDDLISELENSLAFEKRVNELNEREIDLQKRINEVQRREIEFQKQTIQDLKDISDRAIKLAEVSKPKAFGNWQLLGVAGVIGYIISELVHR